MTRCSTRLRGLIAPAVANAEVVERTAPGGSCARGGSETALVEAEVLARYAPGSTYYHVRPVGGDPCIVPADRLLRISQRFGEVRGIP